jgi:Fimbrial assembly protein (PilN)
MQQLAWPWSAWLRTLEAQSDSSVAWLRLEALGDSRTLRLQGESTTMQDATGFVQRLQQAPWVESVALSSHDAGSSAQDGQALQFSVDVRWKLQP